MKKIRLESILIVVIIVCLIAGNYYNKETYGSQGKDRYTATFLDVFDTQTEIIGYATSEDEFKRQVELLKEKMVYYHQLYDIYNNYDGINNVKTINDNAGVAPVEVDREIIELLKLSKEMYEATDGKVNVVMGSVLSIWHEYREAGLMDPANAKVPPMEDLKEAAMHIDINGLIIDEEASTVYLSDPEMSIDIGGIGKGYAVQKVAEYAKELGMEKALISVGGNIYAVGSKADGSKWKVGIINPDLKDNGTYAEKVELENCCVVTSGDYQRYYMVDETKYCHIINPDTLMPADYFPSVSILAQDSGIADALSTAVFNMTLEEGMDFINGLENVEAMWVMKDGEIYYSENFKKYLSK